MNAVTTTPPQRRELTPIEALKSTLSKRAQDFKTVLPAHITPEKFQRVIATAALQNPQLLNCDKQSLLLACMKLAQDGLLPDGREAALVPFQVNKKDGNQWIKIWQVQAMPMAWGLRKKVLQSGEVVSLETGVVYRAELEAGHFIYEIGMEPPIRHRPKLDLTTEETTDSEIVAAYSIARLKNENGEPYWSVEVMRRAEIDKVRQTSQTGAVGRKTRDGKPIEPKGPWVDWYGEMARKTVLRRHTKVLPMSGDIFETLERDIEEERAAESAVAYLAEENRPPMTLPSLGAAKEEAVDEETGEIITVDPATGMTEVDEETARALDAGKPDPIDVDVADDVIDGAAVRQAEAAEQTYRDIDGPLPESGGEPNPWEDNVDQIKSDIASAQSREALKAVEKDFLRLCASWPKPVADEVEALITKRRKEV